MSSALNTSEYFSRGRVPCDYGSSSIRAALSSALLSRMADRFASNYPAAPGLIRASLGAAADELSIYRKASEEISKMLTLSEAPSEYAVPALLSQVLMDSSLLDPNMSSEQLKEFLLKVRRRFPEGAKTWNIEGLIKDILGAEVQILEGDQLYASQDFKGRHNQMAVYVDMEAVAASGRDSLKYLLDIEKAARLLKPAHVGFESMLFWQDSFSYGEATSSAYPYLGRSWTSPYLYRPSDTTYLPQELQLQGIGAQLTYTGTEPSAYGRVFVSNKVYLWDRVVPPDEIPEGLEVTQFPSATYLPDLQAFVAGSDLIVLDVKSKLFAQKTTTSGVVERRVDAPEVITPGLFLTIIGSQAEELIQDRPSWRESGFIWQPDQVYAANPASVWSTSFQMYAVLDQDYYWSNGFYRPSYTSWEKELSLVAPPVWDEASEYKVSPDIEIGYPLSVSGFDFTKALTPTELADLEDPTKGLRIAPGGSYIASLADLKLVLWLQGSVAAEGAPAGSIGLKDACTYDLAQDRSVLDPIHIWLRLVDGKLYASLRGDIPIGLTEPTPVAVRRGVQFRLEVGTWHRRDLVDQDRPHSLKNLYEDTRKSWCLPGPERRSAFFEVPEGQSSPFVIPLWQAPESAPWISNSRGQNPYKSASLDSDVDAMAEAIKDLLVDVDVYVTLPQDIVDPENYDLYLVNRVTGKLDFSAYTLLSTAGDGVHLDTVQVNAILPVGSVFRIEFFDISGRVVQDPYISVITKSAPKGEATDLFAQVDILESPLEGEAWDPSLSRFLPDSGFERGTVVNDNVIYVDRYPMLDRDGNVIIEGATDPSIIDEVVVVSSLDFSPVSRTRVQGLQGVVQLPFFPPFKNLDPIEDTWALAEYPGGFSFSAQVASYISISSLTSYGTTRLGLVTDQAGVKTDQGYGGRTVFVTDALGAFGTSADMEMSYPKEVGYRYWAFDLGYSSVSNSWDTLRELEGTTDRFQIIRSTEVLADLTGASASPYAYLDGKEVRPRLWLKKGQVPFAYTLSSRSILREDQQFDEGQRLVDHGGEDLPASVEVVDPTYSGNVLHRPLRDLSDWVRNKENGTMNGPIPGMGSPDLYPNRSEKLSFYAGLESLEVEEGDELCGLHSADDGGDQGFTLGVGYEDEYYPDREFRVNDYQDYFKELSQETLGQNLVATLTKGSDYLYLPTNANIPVGASIKVFPPAAYEGQEPQTYTVVGANPPNGYKLSRKYTPFDESSFIEKLRIEAYRPVIVDPYLDGIEVSIDRTPTPLIGGTVLGSTLLLPAEVPGLSRGTRIFSTHTDAKAFLWSDSDEPQGYFGHRIVTKHPWNLPALGARWVVVEEGPNRERVGLMDEVGGSTVQESTHLRIAVVQVDGVSDPVLYHLTAGEGLDGVQLQPRTTEPYPNATKTLLFVGALVKLSEDPSSTLVDIKQEALVQSWNGASWGLSRVLYPSNTDPVAYRLHALTGLRAQYEIPGYPLALSSNEYLFLPESLAPEIGDIVDVDNSQYTVKEVQAPGPEIGGIPFPEYLGFKLCQISRSLDQDPIRPPVDILRVYASREGTPLAPGDIRLGSSLMIGHEVVKVDGIGAAGRVYLVGGVQSAPGTYEDCLAYTVVTQDRGVFLNKVTRAYTLDLPARWVGGPTGPRVEPIFDLDIDITAKSSMVLANPLDFAALPDMYKTGSWVLVPETSEVVPGYFIEFGDLVSKVLERVGVQAFVPGTEALRLDTDVSTWISNPLQYWAVSEPLGLPDFRPGLVLIIGEERYTILRTEPSLAAPGEVILDLDRNPEWVEGLQMARLVEPQSGAFNDPSYGPYPRQIPASEYDGTGVPRIRRDASGEELSGIQKVQHVLDFPAGETWPDGSPKWVISEVVQVPGTFDIKDNPGEEDLDNQVDVWDHPHFDPMLSPEYLANPSRYFYKLVRWRNWDMMQFRLAPLGSLQTPLVERWANLSTDHAEALPVSFWDIDAHEYVTIQFRGALMETSRTLGSTSDPTSVAGAVVRVASPGEYIFEDPSTVPPGTIFMVKETLFRELGEDNDIRTTSLVELVQA